MGNSGGGAAVPGMQEVLGKLGDRGGWQDGANTMAGA